MTASSPSSGLVLGLSSDEDDEESATVDDSSNDVGAEGLSTTPSSLSETSSLDARQTRGSAAARPRVAKRSLRGELLDRWPSLGTSWASPARKRLRSASPDSRASSVSSVSGRFLAWDQYNRFWMLVDQIACSTPNLMETLGTGGRQQQGDDCERLCTCGLGDAAVASGQFTTSTPIARPTTERPSPRMSSPQHSPRQSPRQSPRHSPRQSPRQSPRDSPRTSPRPSRSPSPSQELGPASSASSSLQEKLNDARSAEAWRPTPCIPADTKIVILAVPDDDAVSPPSPSPPRPLHPPTAAEASTGVRDELLERLCLMRSASGMPGSEEADKADVEEDSSVLQLLVLTPTGERKLGPVLDTGGPERMSSLSSMCKTRYREISACLKWTGVPYFLVITGIVQVLLFCLPSPYEMQELKNRFVWDVTHLWMQPWRLVSYAMLHSGQMHLALNVSVQTFVGWTLEREQGGLRVAAVFFGGSAYGALATGVISPSLLMVGASAGIYAVLMSHLAQIWLNIAWMRHGKVRATVVFILTTTDMVYTTYHSMTRGNAAPRIGVTAHCAGAVSGMFLGMSFYNSVPCVCPSSSSSNSRSTSCCQSQRLYRGARGASILICIGFATFCLLWIYKAPVP